MPENATMIGRAQELVGRYRSMSRELEIEDAARASTALGQMLIDVERAERTRGDAAARLAEEALAVATRLIHELDKTD